MTALSVNLNAVAQLRNRRNLPWPSVTGIGRLVLEAGADGITIHPRPDERHIRRSDVFELERLIRTEFPQAEYNIEGYPSEEFLQLVEEARPDQVTFVPDDPAQATSDHGWDIAANRELLERAIDVMKALGIRVSLFIDADPALPAEALAVGADRVELYTGPYGATYGTTTGPDELNKLSETARAARAAGKGLGLNAGHDLTLANLPAFQQAVLGVDEVSIGHAITADALLMGFPEAVRLYRAVLG
ncbi:MAG TPA: pyridoxine 5'-phosphate synthase [Devosiaceae bacterium]|nr:pyridoxine 5'-phosphate synthase [Devosiaceae bacterium]